VPAAEPGASASITIHESSCPEDVAPDDRFELCHANGLSGIEFVLDGPVSDTGTTSGPIGAVAWTNLPAGIYRVAEAVPTGEYFDYVVFCSRTDVDEPVLFQRISNGVAAVEIEMGEGAQVVCDWYNIAATQQTMLDFRIAAFNCPEDPGSVSLAAGNVPATCAPAVDAFVTVTDLNGIWQAECSLDSNGICIVQLPENLAVLVYEDEASVAAGYVPRENPLATEVRTEFAGVLFINLPRVQPTDMTLTLNPTSGTGGDSISFTGDGYTPDGAVTVLMTGDGLIVAEIQADQNGSVAGTFTAPDRDKLTGESTNDIPVFAIDEATGRESIRAMFTYVTIVPTTPVPVVGRPIHVHGGSCNDLAATPRYPLTDLVLPGGTFVGSIEAAVSEVSYTVIDVSLEALLAEPHAINAHLSHEDMSTYVACGDIGGTPSPDGSIVIGLREQNGSGFTGIAHLIPDSVDANRTRVTVFLANGLAEEDPTLQPASSDGAVIHAVMTNGPVSPEFQVGYEITIFGDGRAEIVITPEGASIALADADRTAEQETTTVQLSDQELQTLLDGLSALGFFTLTQADAVDPDQLLVGGGVSAITVTLVDGTWDVNGNGLTATEADVLEQAQQLIAAAVGGVEIPSIP
jgi:hypothetical protein